MANIAFFGLGNMGGPMAANLVKAGHQVCVYDLFPAAVEKLVEAGATTANSPKEVAEGAQVVISMLPAGKHVADLYLGEQGIGSVLNTGSLVIEYSTFENLGKAGLAHAVYSANDRLEIRYSKFYKS